MGLLKRVCIALTFFLIAEKAISQLPQEANIWYFGRYIGMDFNSGAPVPLNDGVLNTTEGVATISNSNGDLLFYTDGSSVWNRNHQVMPNGGGLFGSYSSSQSAVIVPFINDANRYYVFTVDLQGGPRGFCYSVVNMSLAGGLGDVEIKNVPLLNNVVEKVNAIRHCNNRDVWVVTHGVGSNAHYSFLITATGVNATPVVSNTGAILPVTDSATLGYMKVSPDGRKIASAHYHGVAELSDFNTSTGVVSNTIPLFLPSETYYRPYGIEFSQNNQLLYTTVFYKDPINNVARNGLLQYDITLATPAAISASKQLISQNSDPIHVFAALQIAPDGKMYMAKNTYKHIAAVNNPNIYGTGCGFVTNAIAWTGANQSSSFGLPTFIQSYFYPPDSFSYVVNCPGLTADFNYVQASNVNSFMWDFDDPASGANNTSTLGTPTHTFTAPGSYDVKLIRYTTCGSDTLVRTLNVDRIDINLGPDTIVCSGTSVLLNNGAIGSTNSFLWQDGSTNSSYLATTNGLYWVQAQNALGCTARDSIQVTFRPTPVFNLGQDTSICSNNILTLSSAITGATYLWNTGATTLSINANTPGIYWCEVNKDGCSYRDSLEVLAVNPAPAVNLGTDVNVCQGTLISLDATNPNSTYLWQDGSINPTYQVAITGLYWVEVTNNTGCKTRDSIQVNFRPMPVFNLGRDTSLCAGNSFTLSSGITGATYLWNTGETTPSINVNQAGIYWCEVNNGCIYRDTIEILAVHQAPVVNLGADVTVCEGTQTTLDATNANSTYLWNDGSTSPVLIATQPGTYHVLVTLNGCSDRDTVRVNHTLKPLFSIGPDQFICPGKTITLQPLVDPSWQLQWQDGSTGSQFIITQPGNYSLTATNNCGSGTDGMVVNKGGCRVAVPSGFTPNGDGLNDIFRVLGTETVTSMHFRIYNRWGELIFETKDKSKGWDGKLAGKILETSVFVYTLSYQDETGPETKHLKGTFTLIR